MTRNPLADPPTRREQQNLTAATYAVARASRASIINRGLLIATFLAVLNVTMVCHYRPESVLAVLRFTPVVTLFAGVLSNLLPWLIPTLSIASFALAVWAFLVRDPSTGLSRGLVAGLFYVVGLFFVDSALLPSTALVVGAVIVAIAVIAVVNYAQERWDQDWSNLSALVFAVVSLTVGIGPLIENPQLRSAVSSPFVPIEELTLRGQEPFAGYVLDVDPSGQWTTVMLESDRSVQVVSSPTLVERTPCRPDHSPDGLPEYHLPEAKPLTRAPVCR